MPAVSHAPPIHETLADMDSHIARLKDKVEEQRKTLQHWQTWDAEYEALKEEVQALAEAPSVKELRRVRAGFDGELLVGKELGEIFGQQQRSRDQVINILDRRIDYVSQNVRSLQTQLEKAELEILDAEASNEQGAVDENGPPITEIVEELDEDGNVLSFRLNRPGDALPRVKAALEKAGIDAPSLEPSSSKPQQGVKTASLAKNEPGKKVKESIALPPESEPAQNATPPVSRMAKRVDGIMKTAKEQEKISSQPAAIPDDEDPDEAALRQQMLKYSMGEMGAVVAELNLEEDDDDGDDFDDDEWLDADEIDLDDDDDEEEDKYGRFTGRMITDKYQRRMLELETKLGVKSRFTQKLEEEAEEKDSDDDDGEGIGRIRIQSKPTPSSASSSAVPTKSIVKDKSSAKNERKKGVRFANELDIAQEAEQPSSTPAETKADSTDIVEPMSELIVERKPASTPAAATSPSKQRPSRFKKAKEAASAPTETPNIPKGPFDVPSSFLSQHEEQEERPVPTGPEGKTIADTLVEKGSVARPADPSELDDNMVHMGVAEEHHRLRSRFIRRDGEGFAKAKEVHVQSLEEAEGRGEHISRFKAARLSRQ